MNAHPLKFLRVFSACTLLVLGLAAAVNILIDPYYAIGTNRIGLFLRAERPYKDTVASTYARDGLMIGNSRFGHINPADIPNIRLFNASFSGARPEEILQFLERHLRTGEVVIIGLDFFSYFTGDPYVETSEFNRWKPFTILENIFSLNGIIDSWQSSWKYLRDAPKPLFDNGARNTAEKDRYNERVDRAFANTLTNNYVKKRSKFWFRDFKIMPRRVKDTAKLASLLTTRKAKYAIILPPWHKELLKELKVYGRQKDLETWISMVCRTFDNVIDLTQSHYSDPENFYRTEPIHFLPKVGQSIIGEALKSFSIDSKGTRVPVVTSLNCS
jgi:hypothetical protein